MFFIVLGVWIVGVIVSFIYGNRGLPLTILMCGVAATALQFTIGIGFFYIAVMAILSIIIWISNKLEMS